MPRKAGLVSFRDQRGVVSLEYAVLAAAVMAALMAGAGSLQRHIVGPFDQIESAISAPDMIVRTPLF